MRLVPVVGLTVQSVQSKAEGRFSDSFCWLCALDSLAARSICDTHTHTQTSAWQSQIAYGVKGQTDSN